MEATIIDRYRKINNGYESNSKKETDLYELKRQIALQFGKSIDYEPATKINDVIQQLIVIHTKDEFKKNVIAYPDSTFHIGDIVDCYGVKWLITKVDPNKQVYTIGEMSQCTLLLKWQNSTGETISRWAVVDKALPSLDGGNIIITSDKKMYIKLPFCSETQNLFVNKRFLTDVINGVPQAYKVTDMDSLSQNYNGIGGILNIELTKDEFNSETDNANLMIADYFSPTQSPTGQAQITGSSTIYVGGSWRYYSATFLDEDGEILSDIEPVWSWISLSNQTDKFTAESLADGRFRIKALLDTSLIGAKIKIKIDDSNDSYHAEQLVEVIDIG